MSEANSLEARAEKIWAAIGNIEADHKAADIALVLQHLRAVWAAGFKDGWNELNAEIPQIEYEARSAAFRYSDEANKYAESFGGKVRQVILE